MPIAIGAIFTECNELGGVPIDLSWFERVELNRGDEILAMESGVVGGMLSVLRANAWEVAPLLFAHTTPGGPLTAACYGLLKAELLERLQAALPVDGVLLPLHGAASAEDEGDIEGDLIAAVREMVGPTVPIVATLDLHAHVTEAMVRHADGLVAWETYPHADAFSTGERGAQLLVDTLAGRCRPTMAMAKVPVITSAIYGSTHGDDPFARLMGRSKALETEAGVLSTSLFLVHPYLDQPNMGSGSLVITDGDLPRAKQLARSLAEEYWQMREQLEPEIWTPADAVAEGLRREGGPIVLIETADCCGGGAAGDSVASLRALLAANVREPSLVPVVDPQAAEACHKAGEGAELHLQLGHQLDSRWGEPLAIHGRVGKLSDGRFRYRGGIYDGVESQMGPTGLLAVGSVRVLITTYGTYDWRDEQYRALDVDPLSMKFVVAKNPMNYRMVYRDTAKGLFVLDTPGPTPASVRHVNFQRLGRPFFPQDADIPGLEPAVLT